MPRGTDPGNITQSRAHRLLTLDDQSKWIALIEDVEARLPQNLQLLLKYKREYKFGAKGRPVRWRIALELSEAISHRKRKDYSIGPDAVDEWWRRLVSYTVVLAAKKKLL